MKKSVLVEVDLLDRIFDKIAAIERKFIAFKDDPVSEIVWLSTQQVMAVLDVKPTTLHHMKKRGELTYTKIGNKVYYDKNSIDKLFNENLVKAGI